jgi:hypothetical protein
MEGPKKNKKEKKEQDLINDQSQEQSKLMKKVKLTKK